jgi:PhzF family phenazine biosynthesis protein
MLITSLRERFMKITLYHIDAFTDKIFSGNPAAVCVMPEWLPDNILHQIAKENNLPVTAFLVCEDKKFNIRWITPEYELDICGHGSLSAGYVIFNFIDLELQNVDLHSRREVLPVIRNKNLVTINFPAKNIEPCSLPLLEHGLGLMPKAIYQHKKERCIAVFDSEEEVKQLKPNMQILKKLEHRGISVTAPGNEVDFVSRTFYPQKMISEDPATGASHCLLAPYWSSKLNKTDFHARQISERRGEIFCQYHGNRVLISGNAVIYMQGSLLI